MDDSLSLIATMPPERLATLWRAYARLGLKPESVLNSSVLHCTHDHPSGLPLTFKTEFPGTDFTVSQRVIGNANTSECPWTTLEVSITSSVREAPSAREFMAKLLTILDEETRANCLGAEHFLGRPKDFSWHTTHFHTFFLAAFHDALADELKDWQRLKVDDPRGGKAETIVVRDAAGSERSVLSNARFYYRSGSRWMVCDMISRNGLTEFSVESAGTPEGWIEALLRRLDERLTGGAGLSNRRMTPSGEELKLERSYGWNDLFLDSELKESLKQEFETFFDRKDLYNRMGLPHRRGLLLHGPPGTGKTLVGKIVASTLENCVFIWVTASDVSNAQDVSAIFRLARAAKRVVLFFEDLDLYASQRSYDERSRPLGELLVQLDGMHSNQGMFVVATTNDLHAIEPALKDRPMRFDRLLEFCPAKAEVRSEHLLQLLSGASVDPQALEAIIPDTEGMTGAQLQELAFAARSLALNTRSAEIGLKELRTALEAASRFKPTPSAGFSTRHSPNADDEDDD